jgi:hypothetical protein
MSKLYHNKVALALKVKVAEELIEQHMPVSVEVIGRHLAEEVDAYTRREHLGYYPPLSYFEEYGGIDSEVLETARNVAWLAAQLVREEVRTRLRAVFSNLRIEAVQSTAFSMPGARPTQPNALTNLTRHVTPDEIRLDLIATLIQKREPGANLERFARNITHRWLVKSFDVVEVTSARLISTASSTGGAGPQPLRLHNRS